MKTALFTKILLTSNLLLASTAAFAWGPFPQSNASVRVFNESPLTIPAKLTKLNGTGIQNNPSSLPAGTPSTPSSANWYVTGYLGQYGEFNLTLGTGCIIHVKVGTVSITENDDPHFNCTLKPNGPYQINDVNVTPK
ncbi:MAG: hypothetical protein COV52_03400 [Gammaproteobacteria bacterium CG11_big_fil_rev_8_21_14_0_20_46_22]|nr:MAG: hypothetical protein COW05_09665 [Gammaproteobacteria bacterium CG12_big_fil_rev_8_21_14_0_65_46_12]PIR11519.1 MAG: hypothetical protein COV52_03400 [Gammaproteobacteria bacterium CG11_big_fil_rev_8_21_14_0_20_46_22]